MAIQLFITILLTLMFLLSGLHKIRHFDKTILSFNNRLSHFNLPLRRFSRFFICMAILIQIISPLLMIYSTINDKYIKAAQYASIVLVFFTIAATILYHFPPYGLKYYPFMSNVTTIAGLLLFFSKCT